MGKSFLAIILIMVVLLIASCNGATTMTTAPTIITTTTQSTITTSIPTTPDASPGAPSIEELTEDGFISPELPRITAERLKQFMDSGESFVLVDTRIEFLFSIGHLPQSINIPFQPEDKRTASFLMLHKDRLIIFYCD